MDSTTRIGIMPKGNMPTKTLPRQGFCSLEGVCDVDKLKICAVAFNNLLNTEYRCIIGRKHSERVFYLGFNEFHFHHLAGLNKLEDIQGVRGSRERVFKNILSGFLTYDMINTSKDFGKISKRLDYLHRLEEFMDNNSIIFKYDNRKSTPSKIMRFTCFKMNWIMRWSTSF